MRHKLKIGILKGEPRDMVVGCKKARLSKKLADKDAQLTALNKTKDIVLAQLGDDVKDYIKTHFGDVDAWATTQIEASMNTLKTTNQKA